MGLACSVNFAGCAIVTSMLTTEAEYVSKAADAIGLDDEKRADLKLLPESVVPGLSKVTYELKDKSTGKRYRCWIAGGITGDAGEASCKVRTADGWEEIGAQQNEPEAFIQIKPVSRERSGLAGGVRGMAADRFSDGDKSTSDVFTPEQHPVMFTDSDGSATVNVDPKVVGNSKFTVRDNEGHSYECHFAQVGDTTSDAVSVCSKIY